MAFDDNTIFDKQQRRMFDRDDDVIIVYNGLELQQKYFNICEQIFEMKVNIS